MPVPIAAKLKERLFVLQFKCQKLIVSNTAMRIISPREFREKNKKSVLLAPIDESTETDVFFGPASVKFSLKESIENVKTGRVTSIRDLKTCGQIFCSLPRQTFTFTYFQS